MGYTDPEKLDPTQVNLYYGTGAYGGTAAQGGGQGLDNELPSEGGEEPDSNVGSEETDQQGAEEPVISLEEIIDTKEEPEAELVETNIPEESDTGVPDGASEQLVEAAVETPPVETVLKKELIS